MNKITGYSSKAIFLIPALRTVLLIAAGIVLVNIPPLRAEFKRCFNIVAIDPSHYTGVSFPNLIFCGRDVGHMPFLENKPDLEQDLIRYIEIYEF